MEVGERSLRSLHITVQLLCAYFQKMASAAPSRSQQIEDSLSCGICFDRYDTSNHLPKSLPCHHTFCTTCVDNLIAEANNYMECPVCRKRITSHEEVCTNHALRDVVEAMSAKEETELLCPDQTFGTSGSTQVSTEQQKQMKKQAPETAQTPRATSQHSVASGSKQLSKKQKVTMMRKKQMDKYRPRFLSYVAVPEQPSQVQSQRFGRHPWNRVLYRINISGQLTITRSDKSVILEEVRSDLYCAHLHPNPSFVHCLSADIHMDEDFALECKKRYGGLEELRSFNARPGEMAYLERGNCTGSYYIYFLVTKETSNSVATIETLKSSLECLREHCRQNSVEFLMMPPLGHEKNDLQWEADVRELLVDVFLDTKVRIIVCMGPP